MNEILGNRIKELRSARNQTQEQLANKIGISRQKYARIESGTNNITLDLLSKIAHALEISVGDITSVLDDTSEVEYRKSADNDLSDKIFDMVDFFYANKRMYTKIQDNIDD